MNGIYLRRNLTSCKSQLYEMLLPDVQAFSDVLKKLPALNSISVQEFRKLMDTGMITSGPHIADVQDGTYPCTDGSSLPWRLWTPPGVKQPPLIVFFHPGAWIVGNPTVGETFCRKLCVRAKAAVISMGYRLAPEHRFPAAHDDAKSAVVWAEENAVSLGARSGPIIVSGASAGANIAVDACRAGVNVAGLLLFVPVTDCNFDRPSFKAYDRYSPSRAETEYFFEKYADKTEWSDPRIACCHAEWLHELPPTTVVAAQCDPFRDEAKEFADNAREAGVDVTFVEATGHTHGSVIAVDNVPSSEEILEKIVVSVRSVFDDSGGKF